MDITVAYFHPLFNPEVVKRDFELLRAAGASSIVLAVHEQEEERWSRDLERGLELAKDEGLKVQLSLGRYGNLFAGPSSMPSWFTFHNPQTRVKDRHGRYHDISCFNHESFRSWLFKEIEHYLRTYPIDGIILDEPRGPDVTCFCSVCRALCPDVTDLASFRRRSMQGFLRELFASVKRVDAHAKTTVILLPQDFGQIDEFVAQPDLDILGGHLFWRALDEDVSIVAQWGTQLIEVAHTYEKRSQLWLQNFNLDQAGEQELEAAFTQILQSDPDEVACYYYWRNNVNPVQVWQTTSRLLKRIPRRQMRWQTGNFRAVTPQTNS